MCIGRGEEIPGGLVGLVGISGEIVPDAVEIDAFPACNEPFRIRTVKVEVPDARVLHDFEPRLDSWNRSIHDHKPLNLVRIGRGVRVGNHVPDVVGHDRGPVVSQPSHDGADVLGLGLLVVSGFRLRRTADPTKVRDDDRVVLHQIRRERGPGVAVLGVSMQQDDNMTGAAGAHEDFRALRTVNGRGVKARRQGRLGLARGRSNGKEHSGNLPPCITFSR